MMKNSYLSLAVQTVVSGIVMYLVMFVMIDELGSFYNNLNMFYMTLMMVAPMVVLMILAMGHMFHSKAANGALIALCLIVFFGSFALIRTQTTIGDTAFLRSMIPPSFRCHPDVQGGESLEFRDCRALQEHHQVAARRDRSDEGHPCPPKINACLCAA